MAIGIDLAGKVACITGAGRGMGRVTALKLAEAGADVVVSDVNLASAEAVSKEVEALGRRSFAIQTDVSDREQVFRMVDSVVEELGHIDIMVNNAGITMGKDLVDVTEEDHDRIYKVNVKGVLFGMQAAMKYFKEQKSGKIINLSSQAAKEAGATYTTYSSSKAAVQSLTQGMAKEAGQYNVNVNAVCPGMILTELWTKDTGGKPGLLLNMEGMDAFKGMSHDEIWGEMCKGMLLGRAQTSEDVAMMVVYLASSFADNISGQGINVSGGMMMH